MNEEQMEEHFGVNREYEYLLMTCAVTYKKFLEIDVYKRQVPDP